MRRSRKIRADVKITIATTCAIAACFSTGCGPNSPHTMAAHKIADALPDVIGPAKHYDVSVEGDPLAIARGHARRVKIDGKDVLLAPSLTMNELHVDADDLALNTKTRQVEHAGHVEFTGVVGQIHLDQYIAHRTPVIKGLAVQIRWTDLEATIPVSAVGINTTVRIDGTLTPSRFGPDKLDFVPSGGDVGIVPVPKRLMELAVDRLNPVMDLSTLKFPVTLESAKAMNGRLYVTGSTTLVSK